MPCFAPRDFEYKDEERTVSAVSEGVGSIEDATSEFFAASKLVFGGWHLPYFKGERKPKCLPTKTRVISDKDKDKKFTNVSKEDPDFVRAISADAVVDLPIPSPREELEKRRSFLQSLKERTANLKLSKKHSK